MNRVLLLLVAVLITQSGCATANGEGEETGAQTVQPTEQKLCPVMEGKRISRRLYVDYKGCRIYLCCKACIKAVEKDPVKYFQKLRSEGVLLEKTPELQH